MLNIEKYKDEIKEIGVGGFTVSKNGELKRCVNIPCDSCAFCLNYGGGGCGKKRLIGFAKSTRSQKSIGTRILTG